MKRIWSIGSLASPVSTASVSASKRSIAGINTQTQVVFFSQQLFPSEVEPCTPSSPWPAIAASLMPDTQVVTPAYGSLKLSLKLEISVNPEDFSVVLRARRKIEEGEEITIQYVPPCYGVPKRKLEIETEWFFKCRYTHFAAVGSISTLLFSDALAAAT